MRNQVGCLLITRFRQMHFVARPTRLALFRVMGLWIIRRVDVIPGGGSVVGLSPAQFSLLPKELLNPDAAQCLYGGYFPYPRWG